MKCELDNFASFGVAGNFTGHLEQAGEAKDFENIATKDTTAPKAIFPTFIPDQDGTTPAFLTTYPFSFEEIIFPTGEEKVQIEPECAVLFQASWKDDKIASLKAISFCASNDCSIRKEGAKKISVKKNWGQCSKGISNNCIKIDSFSKGGILDRYRIASFLIRDGKLFEYGEDSRVKDYSYIYEELSAWLIDHFNNQADQGPQENIGKYLLSANKPEKLLVSIGATRYTEFGKNNFLKDGDFAAVVLYPEDKYSKEEIKKMAESRNFSHSDISALIQKVIL